MAWYDYLNPVTAGKAAWDVIDPSKPYDDAAAAMQNLAGEYQQTGQNLQGQYDQRGQRAQSMYAPWQQAANSLSSYTQQPGAYDQWYGQNAGMFSTPSATADAYGQMQANMPTNYQQVGQQVGSQMAAGPQSTGQAWQQIAGRYGQGAANTARALDDPYMQGQTFTGQAAQNTAFYQQPGIAQQNLGNAVQAFQQPGSLQAAMPGMTNDMRGSGAMSGGVLGAAGSFVPPSARRAPGLYNEEYQTRNRVGEIDAQYQGDPRFRDAVPEIQGATQVDEFGQAVGGEYLAPGQFERFAASAIEGDNPYLDRARAKGAAAIDQAAAARGVYASGGTLTDLQDFQAAQDAELFRYFGDMTRDAQAAQMQRLGQGQGLAQGRSAESMGRGSALGQLASASGQQRLGERGQELDYSASMSGLRNQAAAATGGESLGALGIRSDLASSMDDRFQRGAGMAADTMSRADQAALQRAQGMQQLMQQTDDFNLEKQTRLTDLLSRADQAGLGRSTLRSDTLRAMDQLGLQSDQVLAQIAGQDDSQKLNWLTSTWNRAMDGDRMAMLQLDQLMAGAGQYDDQFMGRLQAGQDAAATADTIGLGRRQAGVDSLQSLITSMVGTQGGYDQQAMSVLADALSGALGLKGEAIGAKAQGDAALGGLARDGVGFLIEQLTKEGGS